MYFKQIDEIIEGRKFETRRVCKPNELEMFLGGLKSVVTFINGDNERPCIKWQVGRDYAVSPGRGKPGVWWWQGSYSAWRLPGDISPDTMLVWQPLRIRILDIRREPLQDISEADAVAEGYRFGRWGDPVTWYRELWENINGKGSWALNPDVWCLSFEVVRDD